MGQIGCRDAFFDAPLDDAQYFAALAAGQMCIKKRLDPVQRQVQGVQDQVSGFVIGIAAAVTEKKSCLIEAAHRETQAVAHCVQRFGCFGKITAHWKSKYSSVRR